MNNFRFDKLFVLRILRELNNSINTTIITPNNTKKFNYYFDYRKTHSLNTEKTRVWDCYGNCESLKFSSVIYPVINLKVLSKKGELVKISYNSKINDDTIVNDNYTHSTTMNKYSSEIADIYVSDTIILVNTNNDFKTIEFNDINTEFCFI